MVMCIETAHAIRRMFSSKNIYTCIPFEVATPAYKSKKSNERKKKLHFVKQFGRYIDGLHIFNMNCLPVLRT